MTTAKTVTMAKNAIGVPSHSRARVRKRGDSAMRPVANPIAIHPTRATLVTFKPGNRRVHPDISAASTTPRTASIHAAERSTGRNAWR